MKLTPKDHILEIILYEYTQAYYLWDEFHTPELFLERIGIVVWSFKKNQINIKIEL